MLNKEWAKWWGYKSRIMGYIGSTIDCNGTFRQRGFLVIVNDHFAMKASTLRYSPSSDHQTHPNGSPNGYESKPTLATPKQLANGCLFPQIKHGDARFWPHMIWASYVCAHPTWRFHSLWWHGNPWNPSDFHQTWHKHILAHVNHMNLNSDRFDKSCSYLVEGYYKSTFNLHEH